MKQIRYIYDELALYLSVLVVLGLVCLLWSHVLPQTLVVTWKNLCGCAVGRKDQKEGKEQLTLRSKNIRLSSHIHPFLPDTASFQHMHANTINITHPIMRPLELASSCESFSS